jgi:aspartate racemase
MIGIVGGVGPYAGIDLLKNIFENTKANSDQDYLDTMLLSMSSKIKDRTEFLLGHIKQNPAYAMIQVILKLQNSGCTVVGIPCNTAHSDNIFNVIKDELRKYSASITLLNMIEETILYIINNYPTIKNIGVLSTTGTYKTGLYSNKLKAKGFNVILPNMELQEKYIHPAIYDPVYGVKSKSDPIDQRARENLLKGIEYIKANGADAVILGCTEIPLVFQEPLINNLITINPTSVLARALIGRRDKTKLIPLKNK